MVFKSKISALLPSFVGLYLFVFHEDRQYEWESDEKFEAVFHRHMLGIKASMHL
jgi:hypothetical protein